VCVRVHIHICVCIMYICVCVRARARVPGIDRGAHSHPAFSFTGVQGAACYGVEASLVQARERTALLLQGDGLAFTRCIVIANIVRCIAYKRPVGGGVVYCPIIVQQYCTRVGNAGGRGE